MRRLLLFLVPLLAWPATAQAAGNGGLVLSPAYQEVSLETGVSAKRVVLTLTNQAQSTANLNVSAVDFGNLDNHGGLAFAGQPGITLDNSHLLVNWLAFDRTTVQINPGKSQQLTVSINNRDDLTAGGHYAAVFLTASGNYGSATLSFTPALATLLYVNKVGASQVGLELQSMATNSGWRTVPSQLTLNFHNTGGIHLKPRGTVELTDPLGHLSSRGIINESSAIILPAAVRHYSVTLLSRRRPIWPGRYTLSVHYRYDGRDDTTTVTRSIWYLGSVGLAGLGLVGVVFIIIIVRLKRNRYRRTL